MNYGEQDEGKEFGANSAKINLNGHAVNELDGGLELYRERTTKLLLC